MQCLQENWFLPSPRIRMPLNFSIFNSSYIAREEWSFFKIPSWLAWKKYRPRILQCKVTQHYCGLERLEKTLHHAKSKARGFHTPYPHGLPFSCGSAWNSDGKFYCFHILSSSMQMSILARFRCAWKVHPLVFTSYNCLQFKPASRAERT